MLIHMKIGSDRVGKALGWPGKSNKRCESTGHNIECAFVLLRCTVGTAH